MASTIFPTWLSGHEIHHHLTNPNIQVGEYSYYSGYYHEKHFEDQCVRYLMGDKPAERRGNRVCSLILINSLSESFALSRRE